MSLMPCHRCAIVIEMLTSGPTGRTRVVAALGITQTIAWGSSYYLPAMLAEPMAREVGVSTPTVFLAFSIALVVSALIGPTAGAAIDRWDGRAVLLATNLVFAAALLALATVQGPAGLFVAWGVLGIGMGSGLYEAAFATAVRLYGHESRGPITGFTLIAGFTSTVAWPLSTWLELHVGWRGACMTWAALHLLVALPLNAGLPRPASRVAAPAEPAGATDSSADAAPEPDAGLRTAVLLSFVFAVTWFTSTAMASHLPRLLQAGGVSLTTAVLLGSLIGPAQVAGRLAEFGFLRRAHPMLSARLAAVTHPVGAIAFMVFGAPAAAAFVCLHGLGNGILTIAKGTLPLVLFGPVGYGRRQGVLMVPARVAQAAAPWLFGIALDRVGAGALWFTSAIGVAALVALLALRAPVVPSGAARRR
ncbi:MFS transporter [soil metagenome]